LSLTKEKKFINRFMEELRKPDDGLAIYGEAQTREAMARGAVDTLLISEGMEKNIIEYSCPKCGKKGQLTLKSLEHVKCPSCSAEVDVLKHIDVVNEFYELADAYGTTVEMISMDFEEGEMLMKAFNGLAAILRYRIGG
ncbi:MAG: peptide chain release factor 1, partial [Thermoplasmata archaeon]